MKDGAIVRNKLPCKNPMQRDIYVTPLIILIANADNEEYLLMFILHLGHDNDLFTSAPIDVT